MYKKLLISALFCSALAHANPLTYIWKRVPSVGETLRQAGLHSATEVILGPWLEPFGTDEAAKGFVRDIGMVPVVSANVLNGGEVASTGYRYDGSHFAAHFTKLGAKLAGTYALIQLGADPKTAARLAAFPGDFFGRYFVNEGRFYQDQDRNLTAEEKRGILDYVGNSTFYANSKNTLEAATQAMPNTYMMSQLNDVINGKDIALIETTKLGTVIMTNLVLPLAYRTNPKVSLYKQKHFVAGAATLWLSGFLARAINGYIMTPISQTFMDGMRDTSRLVSHIATELYTGSGQDD